MPSPVGKFNGLVTPLDRPRLGPPLFADIDQVGERIEHIDSDLIITEEDNRRFKVLLCGCKGATGLGDITEVGEAQCFAVGSPTSRARRRVS